MVKKRPTNDNATDFMRQELIDLMESTGDPFTEALKDCKNPQAASRAIEPMKNEYGD